MSANFVATASVIIAGQGFLLMAIILSIGHIRPVANYLLAALIGVISMRMSVFHLLALGFSQPTLLGTLSQVFFWGGPLLYLYTKALINPEFRLRWQNLAHLLPPLISAMVTPWLYEPHSFSDGYELGLDVAMQHTHALHKTVAVCGFTAYVVAAIRAANTYERLILDQYSSIERATLRWLREILLLSLLIALTLTAWNMHVLASDSSQPLSAQIEFCGNALLFYLIATAGIRRHIQFAPKIRTSAPQSEARNETGSETIAVRATTTDAQAEATPLVATVPHVAMDKVRYDRTSLSNERAQQLWRAVTSHMKSHEPYLDCDLSLADLSEAVGSYPRELSQVLNTVGGQNFYDFVNTYRSLKARELIESDQNATAMIDIALAAGFTGRSTLYKHFAKCFAVTPSQYRKNCRSLPPSSNPLAGEDLCSR